MAQDWFQVAKLLKVKQEGCFVVAYTELYELMEHLENVYLSSQRVKVNGALLVLEANALGFLHY